MSKIQWTERVWNPLTGCRRIGKGCEHCYAERMSRRLAAMGVAGYEGVVGENGRWTGKINLLHEKLSEPLRWRKPSRVFVNSMSDLFHADVPQDFINKVVTVMGNAPHHTFQILTKRYDRPFMALYPQDAVDHIWIGFSICTQRDADLALPYLRAVSLDGWRTWISYEPALELVNWTGYEFVEWLVCGGESGPGARAMHPDWARGARDWCLGNGIPFFFKQWGEWLPVAELYSDDGPDNAFGYMDHWVAQMEPSGYIPVMSAPVGERGGWHEFQPCPDSWLMARVGKKNAGRELDGREWSEYPPVKRMRS